MLRKIIPPHPNGTNKKFARFWYIFKLIKYAVIVVCMTLLPVCQYLYTTEDDFTPAYSSKSSATPTTPVGPTPGPSPGPTTAPPKEPTTNPPNKRSVRTPMETFAGLPPEGVYLYWVTPSMTFRERRDLQNKTGLNDDKESGTRLTDFLVMYPCCTTILVIVGMEMCGQILLDPMTKWTCLFLIVLCIGLSVVIFTISLLAALRATLVIMIAIAVLSMLFLILEIVDFVFVYKS